MQPTIENITPLIKSEKVDGIQVIVHFQADNQNNPIQGYGTIMPDQDQMMKNIGKQAVKSAVKTSIITSISRFFGSLIGGSAGSAVSSASSQIAYAASSKNMNANNLMKTELTPEKRDEAILAAFTATKAYFQWNENEKKWEGIPLEKLQ